MPVFCLYITGFLSPLKVQPLGITSTCKFPYSACGRGQVPSLCCSAREGALRCPMDQLSSPIIAHGSLPHVPRAEPSAAVCAGSSAPQADTAQQGLAVLTHTFVFWTFTLITYSLPCFLPYSLIFSSCFDPAVLEPV